MPYATLKIASLPAQFAEFVAGLLAKRTKPTAAQPSRLQQLWRTQFVSPTWDQPGTP